jgi:hypothetical protein
MEEAMDARLMLIAVSALGFATVAAAEPAKSPAPTASPAPKDRPVILASAEVPPSPAVAQADGTPAPATPARKPRAARVTTCRCADTPNP